MPAPYHRHPRCSPGFLEWWLRQIRALPLRRRRGALPSARPDAVIFAIDELRLEPALAAAGSVLIRRDGREVRSAAFSLPATQPEAARPALPPGLRAGLRLPAGMVLRREMAVPSAAARDLPAMLAFEMDRLTPFDADELLWSIGPAKPSTNRDSKKFSLLLVPRRPVEALLAALKPAGPFPSFVECDTADGANGRIELRRQEVLRNNRQRAGWALCGVLALACLAAPVLRQQLALNAVARQIAALQPALAQAQPLRARLAAATAAQAAIAAAGASGDTLQSLALLTQALPDGTFLSDLTLKSGDLTFDGQSADAAALIAALSAIPAFRDPQFTAPVTRATDGGAAGGADVFSINVTVRP